MNFIVLIGLTEHDSPNWTRCIGSGHVWLDYPKLVVGYKCLIADPLLCFVSNDEADWVVEGSEEILDKDIDIPNQERINSV